MAIPERVVENIVMGIGEGNVWREIGGARGEWRGRIGVDVLRWRSVDDEMEVDSNTTLLPEAGVLPRI